MSAVERLGEGRPAPFAAMCLTGRFQPFHCDHLQPVSYTHLTLPTNREV